MERVREESQCHFSLFYICPPDRGERQEAWTQALCKKRKLHEGPLGWRGASIWLVRNRTGVCYAKVHEAQGFIGLIITVYVPSVRLYFIQSKDNVMQLAETETNWSRTNYPIYRLPYGSWLFHIFQYMVLKQELEKHISQIYVNICKAIKGLRQELPLFHSDNEYISSR